MFEDGEVRLEGWICELFVYLPNMVVYPNSSHMNELSEIGLRGGYVNIFKNRIIFNLTLPKESTSILQFRKMEFNVEIRDEMFRIPENVNTEKRNKYGNNKSIER